ncbi:MAG: hypothetical protein EOO73_11175 [Myxococcales bacterium]|nr:MAG: hypothetical protein EOO73_11175 [Myxococcales bacterium]
MARQQPETPGSAAAEPGSTVNQEAIPSELPNAASPVPAPAIRHAPRPASWAGLLLLLMMTAVLCLSLVYAFAARPAP